LDEETSKTCPQKGFGQALMHGLLGVDKGRQQSRGLTPAVDWLDSLIGSAGGWL
jgi:hypothetical protein